MTRTNIPEHEEDAYPCPGNGTLPVPIKRTPIEQFRWHHSHSHPDHPYIRNFTKENADALLAQIDSLHIAEWTEMHSAPKDGSWIIVLTKGGEVHRASWGRSKSGNLTWCTQRYTLNAADLAYWMPFRNPLQQSR